VHPHTLIALSFLCILTLLSHDESSHITHSFSLLPFHIDYFSNSFQIKIRSLWLSRIHRLYVGLARTMYIWCIPSGTFGWAKYQIPNIWLPYTIYGVYTVLANLSYVPWVSEIVHTNAQSAFAHTCSQSDFAHTYKVILRTHTRKVHLHTHTHSECPVNCHYAFHFGCCTGRLYGSKGS
jgi:hypothetical protein